MCAACSECVTGVHVCCWCVSCEILIGSWPCMFLVVCIYSDEPWVCGMFMYFIRCVMLCQWCVVSVLLEDTWLCIVYVLLCVLFMTCTYMSVYELNHRLVILPLAWVSDTGDRNPQISRVCVYAWEREISMCVWGLLTCTHDLKYLLMWPSSRVTSTDITNAPSDCSL